MTHLKRAPYGTWQSPITARSINSNSVHFDDVLVDPITSACYHIESRSTGRSALVNTSTGTDVVAGEWDVTTGVHGYGGGAAIVHDGNIYFSHFNDGRVYKVREGETPEAVTPESTVHLFANFAASPKQPLLLVSVLEDHTHDNPQTIENSLCVINTSAQSVVPLEGISKADFFGAPTFSPDGTRLVWQQWNHPDMPWHGAELYVADVIYSGNGLSVTNTKHVAGKKLEISAGYPSWVDDSTLIFMSDISGYPNPWKYSLSSDTAHPIFSTPVLEDFAEPAWTFGKSPYALISGAGAGLFTAFRGGANILYFVDINGPSQPQEITPCPFAIITCVRQITRDKPEFVFAASKIDRPGGIIQCTLSSPVDFVTAQYTLLKTAGSADSPQFPREIISVAKPYTFIIPPENDPVHVLYYAPVNPDYAGSGVPGEKPPCVVSAHGGPTGLATPALNWEIQFFTSRGWAWLEVNYGGSAGYGRKYTALLDGKWGVKDVEDCLQSAKALSAEIDLSRVVIRGGSAGGYSVLSALSYGPEHKTFYAAGASFCGISDLRRFSQSTHKFELMYAIKLMGGTIEEIPDVYDKERSPIWHVDQITTPLLLVQGDQDTVVLPSQSESIYNSMKSRGEKVKYVVLPGEGHMFRKAENKILALESEIQWYEEVLKLAVQ